MSKPVTIQTSHPGMRIEVYPHPKKYEAQVIYNEGETMRIGFIFSHAELKKLREALKDLA